MSLMRSMINADITARRLCFWLAFSALFVGLLALAWYNRFIQDDAFISLRYAFNLLHGDGLVWNPGQPPVEGYTNFLWTLLLTIPLSIGGDIVTHVQWFSLIFYAGEYQSFY